jgi:hypothetical protein
MKKRGGKKPDELRTEYKRSDFGPLARGKYAKRLSEATNVVLLDDLVAKAFPNDRAVNKALRSVLRTRNSSPKSARRPARPRRVRRVG